MTARLGFHSWDDVALVIEFAARDGHHVPGTPEEWRHGWDPLTEGAARSHGGGMARKAPPGATGKSTGQPGAHGGATLLTSSDGSKVVRKTGTREAMDREQLAASVAHAVGAPAPKVTRVAPGEIHQEYVAGHTGKQWAEAHGQDTADSLRQTDQGRRIGLLDYVTRNNDRHNENWMVDRQGQPVAVDNGAAFSGHEWLGGDFAPVDGPDVTGDEARAAQARLAALRPEFEAAGHADWHAAVMQQIGKQVPPVPGATTAAEAGQRVLARRRTRLAQARRGGRPA